MRIIHPENPHWATIQLFQTKAGQACPAEQTRPLADALSALYTAIKDFQNLVVIDLEKDDDAQEIFETLNALGTPLLPADLVKNFLFHMAEGQGENVQKLYQRLWEGFDDDKSYWRQRVRQGRLKRARLDLFLGHYLAMLTGEETLISQMFLDYKQHVFSSNGRPATEHMADFRTYADVYESLDGFPEDSREGIFFERLNQMDVSTVYPLLLEVFKKYETIRKNPALEETLVDLESFFCSPRCLRPQFEELQPVFCGTGCQPAVGRRFCFSTIDSQVSVG